MKKNKNKMTPLSKHRKGIAILKAAGHTPVTDSVMHARCTTCGKHWYTDTVLSDGHVTTCASS